jgi:hypothetical protein
MATATFFGTALPTQKLASRNAGALPFQVSCSLVGVLMPSIMYGGRLLQQSESGYCSRTYAQGKKLRNNGQKGCFICVQIILFVIYLQTLSARGTRAGLRPKLSPRPKLSLGVLLMIDGRNLSWSVFTKRRKILPSAMQDARASSQRQSQSPRMSSGA